MPSCAAADAVEVSADATVDAVEPFVAATAHVVVDAVEAAFAPSREMAANPGFLLSANAASVASDATDLDTFSAADASDFCTCLADEVLPVDLVAHVLVDAATLSTKILLLGHKQSPAPSLTRVAIVDHDAPRHALEDAVGGGEEF